jgi:hypothetical protein
VITKRPDFSGFARQGAVGKPAAPFLLGGV